MERYLELTVNREGKVGEILRRQAGLTKKQISQIKFRPGGAKYNVMCPVRTVHFQRANWTKNNHLLPITYEFCIAV